jgi:hemoglobin-like flavoprotein
MKMKSALKTPAGSMAKKVGVKRTRRSPAGCAPGVPILPSSQLALLRRSFVVVESQSNIAALVFYRHLFELDPSLKALFHTSIELQGRKLMEALEFTMATLQKPKELVPVLEAMGRRHVSYGTKQEHYATVTEAMLQTLSETLGENFTPPTEAAWKLALGFVCATMQRGASEVEALVSGKFTHIPGSSGIRRQCPGPR